MKFILFAFVLVYGLALHEARWKSAQDAAIILAGIGLTFGGFVPYQLVGVWRRCHKSKNQDPSTCSRSHGCKWDVYRNRCRIKDRVLLGLRKYWQDRKNHCERKGQKMASYGIAAQAKECAMDRACYWNGRCKARKLHAMHTVHHEPEEWKGKYKVQAMDSNTGYYHQPAYGGSRPGYNAASAGVAGLDSRFADNLAQGAAPTQVGPDHFYGTQVNAQNAASGYVPVTGGHAAAHQPYAAPTGGPSFYGQQATTGYNAVPTGGAFGCRADQPIRS